MKSWNHNICVQEVSNYQQKVVVNLEFQSDGSFHQVTDEWNALQLIVLVQVNKEDEVTKFWQQQLKLKYLFDKEASLRLLMKKTTLTTIELPIARTAEDSNI